MRRWRAPLGHPKVSGRASVRTTALLAAIAIAVAVVALLLSRPRQPPAASDVTTAKPLLAPPQAGLQIPPVAHAGVEPVRSVAKRAPGPGAMVGRVVSRSTGSAIAGAELTWADAEAVFVVRSGVDGGFRFEPLATGRYALAAATADGYLPLSPAWGHSPIAFVAREGAQIEGIVIRMVEAVPYTVLVRAEGGAPVRGATVTILGVQGPVPIPDRFTTGEDGTATITAPDDATITAHHPAHAPGSARVDLAAQVSRRIVIDLGAGDGGAAPLQITGLVVDAASEPIAGAKVSADSDESTFEAVSSSDGAFAITVTGESTYVVTAKADGFASGRLEDVRAGDALTLTLTTGGRIEAKVRDGATGEPVIAFDVWLGVERGPLTLETYLSRSVFDATGTVQIDGLATGRYTLVVIAAGHGPGVARGLRIDAAAQSVLQRTFDLGTGGQLTGVVRTAGGRPIEGAKISVEGAFPISGAVGAATARTDRRGRFAVGGLLPGQRSIVAAAAGHHGRVVSGLAIEAGQVTGPVQVELTPLAAGDRPGLELAGIGAILKAVGERLEIKGTLEGGGAAEAGLTAGDQIESVDGQSVLDLGFTGTIQRIRGPAGTTVNLLVHRPDGTVVQIAVPRRIVRG